MKLRKICNKLNTNVTATFRNSESIIEALGKHLPEFFSVKKRASHTQFVNQAIFGKIFQFRSGAIKTSLIQQKWLRLDSFNSKLYD